MLVAGGKEAEAGTVTARLRNSKEQKVLSLADFEAKCLDAIRRREADIRL